MYLSTFVGPFSRDARDDAAVIDLCIDQAGRSAAAGFAMVTFGEQHYNNYEPYGNPFIMAGRMAGQLGRTWVGTTIVPLPFHHPLRLAEDASLADLLLRGRFLLGMSAGRVGPVPDWDNYGLEQGDRDALFASNLEILQAALAHRPGDPQLRYDTRWGKAAMNGRLMPASWRAGGPLLAIGSSTDTSIERAAASGFPLFLGPCPISVAADKMRLHRTTMANSGFGADAVETAAMHSLVTRNVIVAETDDAAWEIAERLTGRVPFLDREADSRSLREMAEAELTPAQALTPLFGGPGDPVVRNSCYVQGFMLIGSPGTVATGIKEYESVGIPHLNVRFTVGVYDPDRGTPELFEQSFSLFCDEVVPQLGLTLFPDPSADQIREQYRPPRSPM